MRLSPFDLLDLPLLHGSGVSHLFRRSLPRGRACGQEGRCSKTRNAAPTPCVSSQSPWLMLGRVEEARDGAGALLRLRSR